MFFNLGLSYFVLKKDLKWEQVAGACLVVAGVLAAAWPSDSGPSIFAQVRPKRIQTRHQCTTGAKSSIVSWSGQMDVKTMAILDVGIDVPNMHAPLLEQQSSKVKDELCSHGGQAVN